MPFSDNNIYAIAKNGDAKPTKGETTGMGLERCFGKGRSFDKSNSGWRRDLSVSYNNVGERECVYD
jgi:hypothetical protein